MKKKLENSIKRTEQRRKKNIFRRLMTKKKMSNLRYNKVLLYLSVDKNFYIFPKDDPGQIQNQLDEELNRERELETNIEAELMHQ